MCVSVSVIFHVHLRRRARATRERRYGPTRDAFAARLCVCVSVCVCAPSHLESRLLVRKVYVRRPASASAFAWTCARACACGGAKQRNATQMNTRRLPVRRHWAAEHVVIVAPTHNCNRPTDRRHSRRHCGARCSHLISVARLVGLVAAADSARVCRRRRRRRRCSYLTFLRAPTAADALLRRQTRAQFCVQYAP